MNYLDYKIAFRWDDIQNIKYGKFPFPKSLTIFPSEVCNLNCIGCNSKFLHKKNGFMDLDLYIKIINDFYLHGGRAVAFEGGGEPMLHPNIEDLIGYAVSKSLLIGIITNGTVYKDCLKWADWVRFSIPVPFEDHYKKFTGKDLLPKVKENLLRLLREKKITRVGVKYLHSKLDPKIWTVPIQGLAYEQHKNLRNNPHSLVENPKYVKPCGLTPLRAVVDYDGTFYPCPFFHAHKNSAIDKGVMSDFWGKDIHKKAIAKIKNCNKYDCPLLEINWKELQQSDLEFI